MPLSFFLNAAATVLDVVLQFLFYLILIRAVLSWVSPDPYNPIVQFLYRSTEPILRPFRRLLPPWRSGGVDLSPFVASLLIYFLRLFLVPMILYYAARLAGGGPVPL